MYSITLHGLRMPIELFGLARDDPAKPAYGLISGHRRLAAYRHLRDLRTNGDFATIPALLRNPADIAEIYTAMVEENEIRRDLSPWERAAIAVTARDSGVFHTIEQAIDALYPASTRQKRNRLRNIAFLVQETDGLLTDPEGLNQNRLLRLHAAWTTGYGEVIETALTETARRDAASQWEIIRPILADAEAPQPEYTARDRDAAVPAASPAAAPASRSAANAPPTATRSTSPAATRRASSSTASSRRSRCWSASDADPRPEPNRRPTTRGQRTTAGARESHALGGGRAMSGPQTARTSKAANPPTLR